MTLENLRRNFISSHYDQQFYQKNQEHIFVTQFFFQVVEVFTLTRRNGVYSHIIGY